MKTKVVEKDGERRKRARPGTSRNRSIRLLIDQVVLLTPPRTSLLEAKVRGGRRKGPGGMEPAEASARRVSTILGAIRVLRFLTVIKGIPNGSARI